MKRDELELLNNAKNLLKEEVAHISYTTWIEPLEIEEMTDKKRILNNDKNTRFPHFNTVLCVL